MQARQMDLTSTVEIRATQLPCEDSQQVVCLFK